MGRGWRARKRTPRRQGGIGEFLQIAGGESDRSVWRDAYHDLLEAHTPTVQWRHYFDVRLVGIYADRSVLAELKCEEKHADILYQTLISPDADEPLRCTCSPLTQGPCEHTFFLLHHLIESTYSRFSELVLRMDRGDFDGDQADTSAFDLDPRERCRSLLDRIVILREDDQEPDSQLPDRSASVPKRVAWNFTTTNDNLVLVPMLQEQKKRGVGWKRGRKLAIEELLRQTDVSPADKEVRSLYSLDRSYGTAHWEIDSVDAVALLIGQENVLLDHKPAVIEQIDPSLEFVQRDQYCWLQLAEIDNLYAYVFSEQSVVGVDKPNSRLVYCQLTHAQADCLQTVRYLPKIPSELADELLRKAEEINRLFPVRFPPGMQPAVESDTCRPVVLLRSEPDGALDYGLRVRDRFGHLHLPGQGMHVVENDAADTPQRIARDFKRERRVVDELRMSLALPARDLNGGLNEAEKAMQFIERLQSFDSEQVEVLWDESSNPLRVLGTVTNQNVSVDIRRKRDWFQLEGVCELGGDSVSLRELLDAVSLGGRGLPGDYIQIGDKGWARINATLKRQLHALRDSVTQDRKQLKFDATSAPIVKELVEHDVQVQATRDWEKCLQRLNQAEALEPELPADLQADLREYQVHGFQWLRKLAEWGVGGILADDMGLGKTLQTLAVLLDRADQGPSLVIAPTSVGFNWVRECEKFAPGMRATLYRESDRQALLESVGPGDLVVCSYGLALRDASDLASVQWNCLVLDEAQAVKNSRSKTSTAIAKLTADWKIALTGTPVENHLGELWSLFHLISPGVLGGWEQFRQRFAAPIEKENDPERQRALRARLTPFVLRRTKAEVLQDLPPRSEANVLIELSPAERKIYDATRLSILAEMESLTNQNETRDQRFQVLSLITRMRQLACSPRLIDANWKRRSSKLEQLLTTLQELESEGHRVLVFSQFVKHLELIREMLDEEQILYEYLDGSTSAAERQQRVDRFQQGTATAFLISLKAGGTGLNLTAADYVVHMDPWWNPAVEDQATDRAHRIGQDRPVMVYRLIAENTIEEEILRLHDSKRELVAGIMEGSHQAAKLSTQDLMDLVRSGATAQSLDACTSAK